MYTFDDVLLIPAYSEIESREDIDTSTDFLGMNLKMPIISSNMDYVTGADMTIAMYEAGGLGILHRFSKWDSLLAEMKKIDNRNIPFFMSIGIRDLLESEANIKDAAYKFQSLRGICIDVAHGHHKKVRELITKVKSSYDLRIRSLQIIAGNVATPEGALFLADAGADAIKVGIGAGSVCTTRLVTGVGVPQFSAILSVAEAMENIKIPIIADGGIRSSADIAKALGAGATTVMLGFLLAGARECPSPVVIGSDGSSYRPFRGQSIFGVNGSRYVKEGIEGFVPDRGPVKDILINLQKELRSSMSYLGAATMEEFHEKAMFTFVTTSTRDENGTRVRQTI